MIIYQGLKSRDRQHFLCFANGKGILTEVPIDEATSKRIFSYLQHFCDSQPAIVVERNSDEIIEE